LVWSENLLEENYWAHVEMFPATASQYAATALNELTVILLNARAGKLRYLNIKLREWQAASDTLTSEIPTFPYTADECERFINLLQASKGAFGLARPAWFIPDRSVTEHGSNPYITTFVARLWVVVGKQNSPTNH
jgi:hypothetical protein